MTVTNKRGGRSTGSWKSSVTAGLAASGQVAMTLKTLGAIS